MSKSSVSIRARIDSSSFFPSANDAGGLCSFMHSHFLMIHYEIEGFISSNLVQIPDSVVVLENQGVTPIHDPIGVVLQDPDPLLTDCCFFCLNDGKNRISDSGHLIFQMLIFLTYIILNPVLDGQTGLLDL